MFVLPGYHLPITLNRPSEDGGGGIALYISNDYNFKKREDLSYNSNETQFTFVEVERKKLKSLVGVTYNPPKTNVKTYLNCLSEILDKLENSNKKCFVAGDFNIDLLKCEFKYAVHTFYDSGEQIFRQTLPVKNNKNELQYHSKLLYYTRNY